jgi:hypothetical protein
LRTSSKCNLVYRLCTAAMNDPYASDWVAARHDYLPDTILPDELAALLRGHYMLKYRILCLEAGSCELTSNAVWLGD